MSLVQKYMISCLRTRAIRSIWGQCTNSWSDVEKAYRDVQKDGVVEIKLSDDDKVEHFPTVVKNDKKFDSQPIQIFFGKNVPDLKTFTI